MALAFVKDFVKEVSAIDLKTNYIIEGEAGEAVPAVAVDSIATSSTKSLRTVLLHGANKNWRYYRSRA